MNDVEIARRNYKAQTGAAYAAFIEIVNGSYDDGAGRYYVRRGKTSGDGGSIEGAVYPVRVKPGINVSPAQGRKVWIGTGADGQQEIVGNDYTDMIQAGMNPAQLNKSDPKTKASQTTDWFVDLNSYPNGNNTVSVTPAIYRKSGGDYGIYSGNTSIDLLTSYTPATADYQRIVCLWLDETTNTVVVTGSSEVPQTTFLKLASGIPTALTLINECASAAPGGSIGIRAYIIQDDTTKLTGENKFHDLRGFVGSGSTSIGYPNPIVSDLTIPSGREEIMKGIITIDDAILTVNGVLWIE